MILCYDCYEKIKDVPNIVKLGSGVTCFGSYKTCEECNKKISHYVHVEVSNKNIEKWQ